MFESTGSRAAPLAAALDDARRRVNREEARKVHFAYDMLDVRLSAEAALDRAADHGNDVRAWRSASIDVAEAAKVSVGVASTMMSVGEQLWHRLPLVNTAFTAGDLDYGRVSVICSVLGRARAQSVSLLEGDAVGAAMRLTPHALRDALWQLWFDVDSNEARTARESAKKDAVGVHRRKRADGITDVVVTADDTVAEEFCARVDALAATVCSSDPRGRGELRVAAVSAMARDQNAIGCRCGYGDGCPMSGVVVGATPVKRVVAYLDMALLLGLTSNPPTSADGSPLDPEVARLLASDARWQVILTEMRSMADGVSHESAEREVAAPAPAPATADPAPSAASPATPLPEPGIPNRSASPRARKLLRRSRWFTPPPLPQLPPVPCSTAPKVGWQQALNAHIAGLLDLIDRNPSLALGEFPDGHEGQVCPPPGALTYAPSAEVAALVRAKYRTCTAPGCDRPSVACQLDHAVPFDHRDPLRGGWTIVENLHPLCLVHHQAKTDKQWLPGLLADGFVCWRTDTGLVRITAPASGLVTFASLAFDRDGVDVGPGTWPRRASTPPPNDLDAPTWWETHHQQHGVDPVRTESRIASMKIGPDRDVARMLRGKYLEHRDVLTARRGREPAPF